MRVDFIVECLGERDCVFGTLAGRQRLTVVVEPEMELIEKVEAR
jgi:hypothetical protein